MTNALKKTAGRPSKYNPAFCDRVIELAKEGAGWAEYAADFGVDRASLYRWAEQHEDFAQALTRAKVLEQAWFEREGRLNLRNREFNANLWGKSVSARFREDYTERKETQVTGANGGPVQIQSQVVDATTLDQDQRNALRSILLAAKEKKS